MATNYHLADMDDEDQWKREQMYARAEDADEREAMRASGYMDDNEDDDEDEIDEIDDEDNELSDDDDDLDEFRDEPRDDTYDELDEPRPLVEDDGQGGQIQPEPTPATAVSATKCPDCCDNPECCPGHQGQHMTAHARAVGKPKSKSKRIPKPVRVSRSGVKRPTGRSGKGAGKKKKH